MATSKQLDELYDQLDDLLSYGCFDDVDKTLGSVNVVLEDPDILIGMLTITLGAKAKLKNRSVLFARCKARFINEPTSLLDGLE